MVSAAPALGGAALAGRLALVGLPSVAALGELAVPAHAVRTKLADTASARIRRILPIWSALLLYGSGLRMDACHGMTTRSTAATAR